MQSKKEIRSMDVNYWNLERELMPREQLRELQLTE